MVRIRHGLCLVALAGAFAAGGVAQAAAPAAAARPAGIHVSDCSRGYYKNVSGNCIKRPGSDPRGATARCRDGSYSYSAHASGTCSHHGGVSRWIHHS